MTEADEAGRTNGELSERRMWRVLVKAPIEAVWNTLVKTDEVLPFLFGAVCETEGALGEDKPMRMVSRDGKTVIAVGRVLAFEPPHRFSHTISFTQVEGEQPARTTYELKEMAEGTEVTLISEAAPGSKMGKMAAGGPFIVANLKRYAETGKPTFGGAMMLAFAPLASRLAPKRSRAEHWPLGAIS
jgi:uncharacterized protein YndB with AHSA1/START domain